MPAEIQRLCEVMIGIDPNWQLETWLKQQANASLDIISSELEVELKTAEQRLKRITDIKERLKNDNLRLADKNQTNLFDCFSFEIDKSIVGLGSRAIDNGEQYNESHPVNAFLDLLPDDQGDDPLLAVACQNLLMIIEGEMARGKEAASLELIVTELDKTGISYEEIDDCLLYTSPSPRDS